MPVIQITSKADFDRIINSGKVVLVDFFAEWCGPCKQISPVFETLSNNNNSENIEFYKIDVDDLSDVVLEQGIRSMPTFFAYKDGKRIGDLIGAHPGKLQVFVQSAAHA